MGNNLKQQFCTLLVQREKKMKNENCCKINESVWSVAALRKERLERESAILT